MRIKLLIEHEVKADLSDITVSAVRKNDLDTVRLALKYKLTELNISMEYIAIGGHEEAIKLFLNSGATSFDQSMKAAAYNGHANIVRLMLENGATDINGAIEAASQGGYEAISSGLRSVLGGLNLTSRGPS